MNEISFAAPKIAASRQRGIPADEGKLWETLRLDAERVAAGEEMHPLSSTGERRTRQPDPTVCPDTYFLRYCFYGTMTTRINFV